MRAATIAIAGTVLALTGCGSRTAADAVRAKAHADHVRCVEVGGDGTGGTTFWCRVKRPHGRAEVWTTVERGGRFTHVSRCRVLIIDVARPEDILSGHRPPPIREPCR